MDCIVLKRRNNNRPFTASMVPALVAMTENPGAQTPGPPTPAATVATGSNSTPVKGNTLSPTKNLANPLNVQPGLHAMQAAGVPPTHFSAPYQAYVGDVDLAIVGDADSLAEALNP